MAARVLLLILALGAGAWVATGVRSATLEARAQEELAGPGGGPVDIARLVESASAERFRRAARLYEEARGWAPHQTQVTAEAGLLTALGHHSRAVTLLEDYVERESGNPDAWAALARLLVVSDPERSEQARRRAIELSPPVEPG